MGKGSLMSRLLQLVKGSCGVEIDLGKDPISILESEQHRMHKAGPVHLAPSCLSYT